ncbi:hypothetical protein KAR91_80300, partial [Candidatus Pacearchaeota archaeon]|nr:hypothetical protein [Candidatus Pacearchaeota archaeon]
MPEMQFNATNVKPASVSQPQLPISGKEGHDVVITASEILENAAKNGGFLALTLLVTAGEHQGAEGVYRLNLYNNSEKAVEIAYGQLSAICHVVNVIDVSATEQLHNIPFKAVVGLQKPPNDEGYTEIKGVLHSDGSLPGKSTGAAGAGVGASATDTTPPEKATGTATSDTPAWQTQQSTA